MNPDLKQLYDRIEALEKKLGNFYRSSTIERDVENALSERLGISNFLKSSGTGAATTQSVSVPFTPTNITVPAQPSGTVAIVVGTTTYNVLYK